MLSEPWSDLRYRLRALLWRADVERELDEELAFHLEREAEKHIARGVTPEEARRRARLAFGGVDRAKEASRDARGTLLLETTLRDARHAIRVLGRSPGFTLTAVLCLALGIGATGSVFGIVDALFFRPPPGVGDAARIVRPYTTVESRTLTVHADGEMPYRAYLDLRDHARSLAGLAAYAPTTVGLGDGSGAPEDAMQVSGNYFSVLRVRPAFGRLLAPTDDAGPGAPPVVVVSWAYWRGPLGGAPDVLGRRLTLDGRPYTIVGIAPEGFSGIDVAPIALWTALSQASTPGPAGSRPDDHPRVLLFGRLAPDVTREQARAELAPLYARLLRTEWSWDPTIEPRLTLGPIFAARGPWPTTQARIALWLALAAGMVLAIACANTAGLLLSRAVTRRKEFALRLSLGASRLRLVRQLLTESSLLALAGTAWGLALACWATAFLRTLGMPSVSFFARGRVLLFAVAATTGCVLLFGLAPALAATRTDLASAVKEGAREGVDRRSRARAALMVLQVALAAVLLVAAGLFVRSLRSVQAIPTGLDVDRLLVARPDLSSAGYDDAAALAFYDQALERLRHLPGVRSVTLAQAPPLSGGWASRAYTVPDGTERTPRSPRDLRQNAETAGAIALNVGPHYFTTVGTPILAGRDFSDRDGADGAPVVIVNRAFARYEWPGARALDRCVDMGWQRETRCFRVVGVVADGRYGTLDEAPRMAFFVPIAGQRGIGRVLVVRGTGADPATLAPAVRRTLAQLEPRLRYVDVKMLTDVLRPQLQPRWLGAALFGLFGLLALALSAVGLFGVVAFGVAQRTHELGVRMALGASRGRVVRLVVRQGLRLTLAGLAVGMASALVVTRFVAHFLYGVTPTDPLTFVGVAAVLLGAAALASILPAYHAARVDPAIALRAE